MYLLTLDQVIGINDSRNPQEDCQNQADPKLCLQANMQISAKRREQNRANIFAEINSDDVEGIDDAADPEEKKGEDEVNPEFSSAAFFHEHHDWWQQDSDNRSNEFVPHC